MPKRSAARKERSSQAALVCGEAFQRLAHELIPRIGAIEEKPSQGMSRELADVVACATNIGFAIELYLKALLTQLDLTRYPSRSGNLSKAFMTRSCLT
jgi:hypothetical protein